MKAISILTRAAALAAITLFSSLTSADVVINVTETSTGVAVVGSGTLDLEGLPIIFEGGQNVGLNPSTSTIVVGGPEILDNPIDSYLLPIGTLPLSLGPGSDFVLPTNTSGDVFGFGFFPLDEIFVPDGYVSGNPLSGSSFYQGGSLASIGLTPESYGFTIPSGDSVTINITAIPEPTSAALLCGLCGSVLLVRRRR